MRKVIYSCDRCHTETIDLSEVMWSGLRGNIDLCQSCMKIFLAWLKIGKA